MSTIAHFINVGQGNMTLLQLNDGTIMLYDCNVTNDNEDSILKYLANIIGWNTKINIFVNSHRDADHMRGIKKIHEYFPIQLVWDSDVTGGTPDSSEYKEYMDLRRKVGFKAIEKMKYWTYGKTKIRVMNSKNDDLPNNHNAQSIVMKVEHHDNNKVSSLMLTGDTDALSWKDSIVKDYSNDDIKSNILLASHHGSKSFFDDPSDKVNYYTEHLQAIKPQMTIISVGDNGHGHPHEHSISLYEKYSTGSNKGNKIKRTDTHGNIKLELKDNGSWSLN